MAWEQLARCSDASVVGDDLRMSFGTQIATAPKLQAHRLPMVCRPQTPINDS